MHQQLEIIITTIALPYGIVKPLQHGGIHLGG
jgi:hypothetical protein